MVAVRRIRAGEGPLLKRVRLAALADAPGAFSSTHAGESTRTDEEWSERARLGSSGVERVTFFAIDGDGDGGNVVGLAGGYRETAASTTVDLVSMWVDPSARKDGVGRALVEAVVEWAASTGAEAVELGVVQGNEAAERLYAAAGFTPTGHTEPFPPNPELVEVRMRRPVG